MLYVRANSFTFAAHANAAIEYFSPVIFTIALEQKELKLILRNNI